MNTGKYIFIIFFLSAGAILIQSCRKAPLSNGDKAVETRQADKIRVVTVYDNFDIAIVQATETKVVVEAGEHIIPIITTEISGDTLKIDNRSRMRWLRDYRRPVITVYTDTLREIFFRGSSRITTPGQLTGQKLILWVIDDYCEADLNIDYHHVFFISSRTTISDIRLKGKSVFLEMMVNNGCSVKAGQYEAMYASIITYAITDTYIGVKGTIVAHLYNSGNIFVKGSPEIIEKKRFSKGDIYTGY